MNVLVVIDQEGCHNINPNQSSEVRVEFMKTQLKEFIKTIPASYNIDVLDCHDNGLNVQSLKSEFPKIKFIAQIWNFNVKKHYDCAVLIGFHAAQGANSPFAHTFRNEIKETILNSQNVGEVTLLVHWLSSFNIPVLLVHGEVLLKQEVEQLDIPFCPNCFNLEFPKNILPKLNNFYIDNNEVKIRLMHNIYLDVFPPKLFNIENNFIIFKNINQYMNSLSKMSIFLNAARNYFFMYMKNIINNIRWNYSSKDIYAMNDQRLTDIFNKTINQELTYDDIIYIKDKLSITF